MKFFLQIGQAIGFVICVLNAIFAGGYVAIGKNAGGYFLLSGAGLLIVLICSIAMASVEINKSNETN